jgi:hypothetical protein
LIDKLPNFESTTDFARKKARLKEFLNDKLECYRVIDVLFYLFAMKAKEMNPEVPGLSYSP